MDTSRYILTQLVLSRHQCYQQSLTGIGQMGHAGAGCDIGYALEASDGVAQETFRILVMSVISTVLLVIPTKLLLKIKKRLHNTSKCTSKIFLHPTSDIYFICNACVLCTSIKLKTCTYCNHHKCIALKIFTTSEFL